METTMYTLGCYYTSHIKHCTFWPPRRGQPPHIGRGSTVNRIMQWCMIKTQYSYLCNFSIECSLYLCSLALVCITENDLTHFTESIIVYDYLECTAGMPCYMKALCLNAPPKIPKSLQTFTQLYNIEIMFSWLLWYLFYCLHFCLTSNWKT